MACLLQPFRLKNGRRPLLLRDRMALTAHSFPGVGGLSRGVSGAAQRRRAGGLTTVPGPRSIRSKIYRPPPELSDPPEALAPSSTPTVSAGQPWAAFWSRSSIDSPPLVVAIPLNTSSEIDSLTNRTEPSAISA